MCRCRVAAAPFRAFAVLVLCQAPFRQHERRPGSPGAQRHDIRPPATMFSRKLNMLSSRCLAASSMIILRWESKRPLTIRACVWFGHHRERLLEICRAAYQDRVKTDTDVPSYRRVESLAHPGGNITGISAAGAEMAGKRLELLRQLIPNLSRVAVLASDSTTNPFIPLFVRETTYHCCPLHARCSCRQRGHPNDTNRYVDGRRSS
jgi:ABC transporter substrate binding protein